MPETKMSGEEVLAEVEWLLTFGIHPELIARQLDRSCESIARMARRRNNTDIARLFDAVVKAQRLRDAA